MDYTSLDKRFRQVYAGNDHRLPSSAVWPDNKEL
jgi:hypothetical protein